MKAPCPLDRVNRQFKAELPNQLWVTVNVRFNLAGVVAREAAKVRDASAQMPPIRAD
jgi:hypothetical protein